MSATNTYIIYETTNLVNGKFYIGVHKVNGSNYLGSGTLLKLAIKKYKKESFMRETLETFNNEQDAYNSERLIVNINLVNNPNCYNIVIGGGNPPTGYGNNNNMYGKKHTQKTKKIQSLSATGRKHSNNNCIKISNSHKGKIFSENHKHKLSESKIGKNNPNSKKWVLFGKLFYSSYEAGNYFNVSDSTIRMWCNKSYIPLCYYF